MSMQYLTLAFTVALTGSRKAVLIALADRANHAGYCYPSMTDIAERAGCTKRTAISAIKALEKDGFIVAIRDQGRVNKYIILPGNLSTTSETGSQDEVINSGENFVETGEIFVETGETISPKPINPLTQKTCARGTAKNFPENPDRPAHKKTKSGAEGLRGIKAILADIAPVRPSGGTQSPPSANTRGMSHTQRPTAHRKPTQQPQQNESVRGA